MAQPRKRAQAPKTTAASADPSTPSLAYKGMGADWAIINTTLGGTAAMRAAGQTYLPKHMGEKQKNYDERLNTAVFTNFMRLTLDFLVGKPYSEVVQFRQNTPAELLALESDMDLCGNDVTTVTKDFFWKGMAKGWSYLMVEYPTVNETEITLAQAQNSNLRPYWVILNAENVISDVSARINGKDEHVHVRILNSQTVRNGYDEIIVNRIFEYNLISDLDPITSAVVDYHVEVTVFKQDGKNWPVEQPARTLQIIKRIPLVKFQTNDEGRPEVIDLAYLNVTHWQSMSDQRACLTMARFPILAGSGMSEDDGKVVGPYELLTTSDPTAKFYYVEHNGQALNAGDNDVGGLEDKMAMYGAQMLKKRPGRETATSRVLDEAENLSPLQIIVLRFMSSLESACDYTLQWLQAEEAQDSETYGIDVKLDFALSSEQEAQMSFFENARLQGDISRENFWLQAKALGYCPQDFNIETNETQLAAEVAAETARNAALMALKGQQGNQGSGTGDPLNNPNDPKIKRSNVPAV
jgi:uncharacterized protein DUF4055